MMTSAVKECGKEERGNEFLRCGAQTPIVTPIKPRLRGHGIGSYGIGLCRTPILRLCLTLRPRRWTLGVCAHSVGIHSHAPNANASSAYASFLSAFLTCALLLAPALYAAPKDGGGKDAVQVQTALSGAGSGSQETNLGDLVADAVRQTGSAQVALIPADEIDAGASIPAGKTAAAKIVSSLRYADDPSDTVVMLTLTGAQLLKIAERSVSRAPTPFEGFLQVSGLQIRYSAGQPEGRRVSLVGVGGSEIDAGKSYQVATTRALAGGALGYFQIFSGKSTASDTGATLAKSLRSYLSAHPTIANTVEGRITRN